MPTLMPNGPGTDHTPPRKPLQPLNSGFLIYFLLPPLVNCYPLPYLRVLIIKSFIQFSSVPSVVSNSLQPHGLQYARLPCPPPTPRRSLKLMSIKSVMPFNHLIFCHTLLFLPSIFPSIRGFSNESVLLIRWPKYCSFRFSISPSN